MWDWQSRTYRNPLNGTRNCLDWSGSIKIPGELFRVSLESEIHLSRSSQLSIGTNRCRSDSRFIILLSVQTEPISIQHRKRSDKEALSLNSRIIPLYIRSISTIPMDTSSSLPPTNYQVK